MRPVLSWMIGDDAMTTLYLPLSKNAYRLIWTDCFACMKTRQGNGLLESLY
jgi:hypothetical protein